MLINQGMAPDMPPCVSALTCNALPVFLSRAGGVQEGRVLHPTRVFC